jgi:hypothetical protein
MKSLPEVTLNDFDHFEADQVRAQEYALKKRRSPRLLLGAYFFHGSFICTVYIERLLTNRENRVIHAIVEI